MKYLLLISLTLILLSCQEKEEKTERIFAWDTAKSILYNDTLFTELGINFNDFDGIIVNEIRYDAYTDEDLYNQNISAYFNRDNDDNLISSFSINYEEISSIFKNKFDDYSWFKSEKIFTKLQFVNNGLNVTINLENEFKNYAIQHDTLDSDINLQLDKYDYAQSSLFLYMIARVYPYKMLYPKNTLMFFNNSDLDLTFNYFKSEIEKYFTLSDEIGLVFYTYHVKYNIIENEGKKYLILNKDIYPIKLRYLPE